MLLNHLRCIRNDHTVICTVLRNFPVGRPIGLQCEEAKKTFHALSVDPKFFGTRDRFCGSQFFNRPGWEGDGLGMIQVHYIQVPLLLRGPVPNWPTWYQFVAQRFGSPV